MEEKVEKVETEVFEVNDVSEEMKAIEKKDKRKAIIKKALIALGGLAVVGGALAVLVKKDDEIEEFSPVDLDRHGVAPETHTLALDNASGDNKNLYKITEVRSKVAETQDETAASEQNT